MTSKYIFFSLALVVLLGLLFAAYSFGKHSIPPIATETITNNTYKTTLPVETKVIREKVPAIIDTVFIDGRDYEIARYHAIIDTSKVNIELDIEYREFDRLFNVRHNIRTIRDSIYVEKIVDRIVKDNPAFLRLIAGFSLGTNTIKDNNYNISYGDISAGIKIADRYSIQQFVGFQEAKKPTYGIRLGIDL